ncbi:MAG: T9SS type A sorting domain-containing protein [Calditrichaeota bacterium]|nr:T9SS type A sorting domain-containing protein [Calditrichota bacterium]
MIRFLLNFMILILLVIPLISVTHACPKGKPGCGDDDTFTPFKGGETAIDNGNWEKYEFNPVFTKGDSASWDAAGVTCFCVRHFPHSYMMWYTASAPGANKGFGLATSEDGINWERHPDNPVMVPDTSVTVWGPEVLYNGERYDMWYVSRGMDGEMDGISHATSEDGVEWVQSEENPVIDHGGCMAVIWDPNAEVYRMFLQHTTRVGRQPRSAFELLTSEDGDEWNSRGFPFITGPPGNWDEITAAPSVAYYEDQLLLWYTGADTMGNRRGQIAIGHVTSDDWGNTFNTNERERTEHRELRPEGGWEGNGIYSSGIDYDGENVYIWYAARGFGYASRPENSVNPKSEVQNPLNLWSISPNPTSGPVKLSYLGTMDAPVSVRMFDMNGRELLKRTYAANEAIRVNPTEISLPIGQYVLSVNARGKEIQKRMVLVK